MNHSTAAARAATARAAVAGIALFLLVVAVLHIVQAGDYHPVSQAVSELALGRAGWLMAVAFCSLATGMLLLAVTLHRLAARPLAAAWAIAIAGLLTYGSAFVHADRTGAPATTHGNIHQALGIATFLLLIAAMFASIRAFRRDPAWHALGAATIAWAPAALAAFFLIPITGTAHFGIAQRVFLAVVLGWIAAVSIHASRTTPGVRRARTDPSVAPAPQP